MGPHTCSPIPVCACRTASWPQPADGPTTSYQLRLYRHVSTRLHCRGPCRPGRQGGQHSGDATGVAAPGDQPGPGLPAVSGRLMDLARERIARGGAVAGGAVDDGLFGLSATLWTRFDAALPGCSTTQCVAQRTAGPHPTRSLRRRSRTGRGHQLRGQVTSASSSASRSSVARPPVAVDVLRSAAGHLKQQPGVLVYDPRVHLTHHQALASRPGVVPQEVRCHAETHTGPLGRHGQSSARRG